MQTNAQNQDLYPEYCRFISRPSPQTYEYLANFAKEMIFAIDLENCMQYLYSLYEGKYVRMQGLVEVGPDKKYIMLDIPQLAGLILSDVVDYLYALIIKVKEKYDLTIYPVIFGSIGQSSYHLRLDESYKKNRRLSYVDLKDPVLAHNVSLVNSARRLAFKLMNELIPLIPRTTAIILDRWEADIVPCLLEKYAALPMMTLSNDSDMLQLVSERHLLWRRVHKKSERYDIIVSLDNVHKYMFMVDISKYGEHSKKCVSFYSLAKAIMGDSTDHVIGLRGWGPVRVLKMLSQWVDEGVHKDQIYDDDELGKLLSYKTSWTDEQIERVMTNFYLVDFKKMMECFEQSTSMDIFRQRLRNLMEGGPLIETMKIFQAIPNFNSNYQLLQLLKLGQA